MLSREKIQAEIDRIDALLESPNLEMYEQTYLEAAQQSLLWALGERPTAPVTAMQEGA